MLSAVQRAGSGMHVEDSPRLDHDTENESGTPPIAETILRKIKNSAIMIADMTFCSEIREDGPEGKVKKKNPNPNVMMELGYAAAIMGWSRIILVINTKVRKPAVAAVRSEKPQVPDRVRVGAELGQGARNHA